MKLLCQIVRELCEWKPYRYFVYFCVALVDAAIKDGVFGWSSYFCG